MWSANHCGFRPRPDQVVQHGPRPVAEGGGAEGVGSGGGGGFGGGGNILFALLPFIIWMFDTSVTSEISFGEFTSVFTGDFGWFFKLVALALIWAYLHHFVSGVRHLIMDATHRVTKEQGKSSAIVTLVLGFGLTAALALKLFGVF